MFESIKNKIYNKCLNQSKINVHKIEYACSLCKTKKNQEYLKLANGTRFYGILGCKNCSIMWNRDINASKNMPDISSAIWDVTVGRLFLKKENRRSEHVLL